ncbi:tetratricopeptide repeat protein [Qipengyuania sp.]|uniref:tetratricopeptide repeat protein n=1 Tax=Qipengyuania sp. TaxID=2004515 RepID=UPI0035C87486
MIWLPFLILTGLVFAAAALLLKLPRSGYTLFAAALVFGLAGYAAQGVPGMPAAPGQNARENGADGELVVEGRREFFDPDTLPSRSMITSDAFARRGDFENAVGFARAAAQENPGDIEAWTGLGNALVEHAGGQLTPAAIYAYSQAESRAPNQPAAPYFIGLALLRSGQPERTREIWSELLAAAPEDAPWRPALAERLARLESLMTQGMPAR